MLNCIWNVRHVSDTILLDKVLIIQPRASDYLLNFSFSINSKVYRSNQKTLHESNYSENFLDIVTILAIVRFLAQHFKKRNNMTEPIKNETLLAVSHHSHWTYIHPYAHLNSIAKRSTFNIKMKRSYPYKIKRKEIERNENRRYCIYIYILIFSQNKFDRRFR